MGNIAELASLGNVVVERSCVVVVFREEGYSGICGVLRGAVAGDRYE